VPGAGDDRRQHRCDHRLGATTLLTRTYTAEEKGKVQALNDFLIFGTVALSSFASGALLSGVGWAMVQIAIMPFVAVAAIAERRPAHLPPLVHDRAFVDHRRGLAIAL